MIKKKYKTEWDGSFRDEFNEWFLEVGGCNPFIANECDFYGSKKSNAPSMVEFIFYNPSGEINYAQVYNKKHFDIDEEDEKKYEKIYKSIKSKHKKIKYSVVDLWDNPFPWYKSTFGKHKGVGYEELFMNLESLKKIPTLELPGIVKKNCQNHANQLKKIVNKFYESEKIKSKIPSWQHMAWEEIQLNLEYHPYMYELLPELAEEAYKFKKDKTLFKKVSDIIWSEIRVFSQKINEENK